MEGVAQRAATGRVRLARLAGEAIALTGGVAATAGPDGRYQTPDGGDPIPGVVAAALADGRIEVMLHLDALWPPEPFVVLAQAVRSRLESSATVAGLEDRLGPVEVAFHDVLEPPPAEGPR